MSEVLNVFGEPNKIFWEARRSIFILSHELSLGSIPILNFALRNKCMHVFYKHKYFICNFPELGEIAESTDECENVFDAVSRKCICQNNYFYERNLRACRKRK